MRSIAFLGALVLFLSSAASADQFNSNSSEGPYGTGNNGWCVSRPGTSCPTGRQTRQAPPPNIAPAPPPVGTDWFGAQGNPGPSQRITGPVTCQPRPGMSCPTGTQGFAPQPAWVPGPVPPPQAPPAPPQPPVNGCRGVVDFDVVAELAPAPTLARFVPPRAAPPIILAGGLDALSPVLDYDVVRELEKFLHVPEGPKAH